MPVDGTCRLCGNQYRARGLSRHLQSCLPKRVDRLEDGSGEAREAFHVAAHGYGVLSNQYRIDLVVAADATLKDVDTVLRRVWMECCGHKSAFYTASQQEADMNARAEDVLAPREQLTYVYDFGTSSEAELNVREVVSLAAPVAPVQLIARNDPPTVTCHACDDATATQVCATCVYRDTFAFCDACADAHEDACPDRPVLRPIVNAPRTGLCGYTGPSREPDRLALDATS